MAEVEALSEPLFFGVPSYDVRLERNVGGHDPGKKVKIKQFVRIFFQRIENFRTERAVFDDLAQSAADLPQGKRAQESAVHQHAARLTERAHKVFDPVEIDGGLSADGGIHLREERGGHLNAGDAAHIQRRRKSAHITHDAAAQAHERIRAVHLRLRHGGEQCKQRFGRLVFLARRHHVHGRSRKISPDRFAIQRIYVGVGKDHCRRRGRKLFKRIVPADDDALLHPLPCSDADRFRSH